MASHFTGIVCCMSGPLRSIQVGGRRWWFEMHRYCGPMPVNQRTGRGIDGTKAFWHAVTLWAQQGERIDADGLCEWDPPPPPPPLYRLARSHYTEGPKMAARFGVTEPIALGEAQPVSNVVAKEPSRKPLSSKTCGLTSPPKEQ